METDFEANKIGLDSLTLEEKKYEAEQAEKRKQKLHSLQNDESNDNLNNNNITTTTSTNITNNNSSEKCKSKILLFFTSLCCCYSFE